MTRVLSVLYVDDEPMLLDIAKLFLERDGGFAVTTFLSAQEALASPVIASCDAIVADYQMPGMDGIELLKEVRRQYRDIPFILFTGRGREEVVIEAINSGVDFYLQKGGDPVAQFAELVHKIRQAVQRKEAEAALRESEENYRTLFETTGTAMVRIEEDTTLSLVNNEFLQATGYTRDEVENRKKWTEFVVKEDLDRMLAQHKLRRTDHDRALTHYEFHLLTKSGAVRDIHLTVDTIPGTKKSVASLLDITAQKKANAALRESESRFRSLVETTPNIIWELDAKGTTVYVSPGVREMVGFSPEEITGRPFMDNLPPAQKESAAQMFKTILATGNVPFSFELPFTSRDGRTKVFEIRPVLLTGSDGAVTGLRGVAIDITGRKESEEKLKESERKFRDFADFLPQSVWECDRSGVLTFANRGSFAMYRYTPEDFLQPLTIFQMVTPGDRPRVAAVFADAIGRSPDEFIITVEYTALRKDGSTFPIKTYVSPVIRNNAITGARGIGIDMTDQKRIEQDLLETGVNLRAIFDSTFQFTGLLSPEGILLDANRTSLDFIGVPREAVINRPFRKTPWWNGNREREERLEQAIRDAAAGSFVRYEVGFEGVGGTWITTDFSLKPVVSPDGTVRMLIAEARDITERKEADNVVTLTNKVYELAQQQESLQGLLDSYVAVFKEFSGCEAVGIRLLDKDGNIPYQAQSGFPMEFYEKERPLNIKIDECMCIYVIEGKLNPDLPVVTPGGSFYCNGTSRFLSTVSEEEKGRTRNICNAMGYESVALIPLRSKSGISGLIQFNDHRENMVPLGLVQTIEKVAVPLGQTIHTRQAEEALRESEENYRSIIENMQEMFYRSDCAGNLLMVTPAGARLAGYESPEEMIGKNIADYWIHPEEREKFLELLRREGSVQGYPATVKDRFGSIHYLSASCHLYRDKNGRILGVEGMAHDITLLKQAEEALQTAREKYSTIFQEAPDAITISDLESGKFIEVNDAAERVFGYPREELIGHSAVELGIWREQAQRHAFADLIREKGRVEHYEVTERRKSGELYQALVNADSITIGDRKCILAIIRDVTREKQAEEALQIAQEKYSTIFRDAPDAITISDLESGKFIEVNDAAVRVFGYPREELIGHSAIDVGIWLNRAQRDSIIARIKNEGRVERYEVTERRKSGEVFPGLISADSITIGGRECMIAITRDMTREKQAEEELRLQNRIFATIAEGVYLIRISDGTIVFTNDKFDRMFGYGKGELIGRHVSVVNAPQDEASPKDTADKIMQALSGTGEWRGEVKNVRKDGTTFWCLAAVSTFDHPVFGKTWISAHTDITERKAAEEALKKAHDELEARVEERTVALKESEERLRLKLDSVLSPDTDINGLDLANIVDIPEIQSLMEDFSRLTGMGTAILDLKGNVIEASGWQEICTKFHRANEKTAAFCRESDLYLSKNLTPGQYVMYKCKNGLWDVITPLYIGTKHAANIYTGQFFMADEEVDENAFIARADEFGFDRDAYFAALSRVPRFTREQVDVLMDYMARFTGMVSRLSYSNLKLAQAMARQEQVAGELRKLSGELDKRVVERTAELSRAQDAYRKANEKLNLLTSITRHDIRNQLTILHGFLELSARSSPESPAAREYLQKSKKALESIRDQIEFTKVYQDLGTQAPAWQNMKSCAGKAASDLDVSRVNVDFSGLHGFEVSADPLFPKVFFNILDNALRYGGEKMTRITCAAQVSGDTLRIVCEDDGEGILPAEKEKVFERGYGKNTGLGLFLIREILGITGITIRETGTPGKGARFEMSVPAGAWRSTGKA